MAALHPEKCLQQLDDRGASIEVSNVFNKTHHHKHGKLRRVCDLYWHHPRANLNNRKLVKMPYIQENQNVAGYLVYNAPVDEKTKRIREMFDVDEETGYPRQYSWRAMARLGKSYTFDEPFLKLSEVKPDDLVSSRVTFFAISFVGALVGQFWLSRWSRRSFWSRPYNVVIMTGGACLAGYYAQNKTSDRQSIRNAVTIDYIQKHPDRFGRVERPKLREVLFAHTSRHS